METVRIDDVHFDQAEVAIKKRDCDTVVSLDFDPDCYMDGQSLMQYSPEQARKLAAALILAADEAENQ